MARSMNTPPPGGPPVLEIVLVVGLLVASISALVTCMKEKRMTKDSMEPAAAFDEGGAPAEEPVHAAEAHVPAAAPDEAPLPPPAFRGRLARVAPGVATFPGAGEHGAEVPEGGEHIDLLAAGGLP